MEKAINMPEYVKQHYIPQFWLKYFADKDGYVCFVNKKTNKESYEKTEDLFYYKNLYDQKLVNDIKQIEKNLSRQENDIKPIFDKLQSKREIILTHQEVIKLLIFLYIQEARNKKGLSDFKRHEGEEIATNFMKRVSNDLESAEDTWKTILLSLSRINTVEDINDYHKAPKTIREGLKFYLTNYHINLFEVKGDTELVMSDVFPLHHMVETIAGGIPLITVYPISKKRLLVVAMNDEKAYEYTKVPINPNKFKMPYGNQYCIKMRVSTLYEKEAIELNHSMIKYCTEGYIK